MESPSEEGTAGGEKPQPADPKSKKPACSRLRVRFLESGGGWGNPLLGRVFDSHSDIGEDEADVIFDELESRLNDAAEANGFLPMTIPVAYIEAVRPRS